jgi:alpha-galactosidase
MAFYLRFERGGQDLYPLIRQVLDEGRAPDHNLVRYELFRRVGRFVTESSEHFAEYVPWFIKRDRPDLIEQFNIPLDEYITRCENQIAGWHKLRARLEQSDEPIEVRRSAEYGSQIIHAMETGRPQVIYGNVANHGLIDNLPAGCCVEVPCLVDGNGIQPTRAEGYPAQLAALNRTNINVQELIVEAALRGSRDAVHHAVLLDPLTAAVCTLPQIHAMVDEMLAEQGRWLPQLAG